MREIKFRAWHKKTGKMLRAYPGFNLFTHVLGLGKQRIVETKEVELMQYTGLKDKNGKEIYEGDIVQRYTLDKRSKYQKEQADRVPFVVVWRASRVHNGWNVASGIFEVIGNIYENKELLDE